MSELNNFNIGIFAPMNLNRFAGDTTRIVELTRGLRSHRLRVTPIIPFLKKSKNIASFLEPYQTFKIPLSTNTRLNFVLLTIFSQYLLNSKIQPEKFDIFQIEWPFALPFSKLRQIASQDNVIFDMHSITAFDLAPFIPRLIKRPIIHSLLSSQDYLFRNSECLVVSHQMKHFIIERLNLDSNRIHVITNGVNIEAAEKAKSTLKHHYEYLREGAEPLLIYVGGLEWYEGVDLIIRAVKKLREQLKWVRLVIAGRGSEEKRLMKLVSNLNLKNHIKFLGWIPYDDAFALQSVADILLAPRKPLGARNFDISCPLKIPAYLTAGKPILTTAIGEIPFLVHDEREALLVKIPTARIFAKEILRLWNDSALMKRMSNSCLKRAFELDWTVITERLIEVYKRILN